MKTTVEINDELLAEAKVYAAERKTSLRRVLEDSLVLLMRRPGGVAGRGIKLRKHAFGGKGLSPSVGNMTPDEIREMVYEGRGGMEADYDRD